VKVQGFVRSPRHGEEPIFGANPLQCRRHFLFAGKRNAFSFTLLGATATTWDTVKGARHHRFAGGRVPIKNSSGTKVKALQVGEAYVTVDGGIPGKPLSPTAKYRHQILS
jgi:hypothetical protein